MTETSARKRLKTYLRKCCDYFITEDWDKSQDCRDIYDDSLPDALHISVVGDANYILTEQIESAGISVYDLFCEYAKENLSLEEMMWLTNGNGNTFRDWILDCGKEVVDEASRDYEKELLERQE